MPRADGPVRGRSYGVPGTGTAADHGRGLLLDLGGTPPPRRAPGPELPGPGHDWAASGAMSLTGHADGPPLPSPGAPASATRGALLALAELSRARTGADPVLPGTGLLSERAALGGLHRQAPLSAGGAFRCIRAADGWLGLSLARSDDLELVPALVEAPVVGDPWQHVASWAAGVPAAVGADRAALLGLPAAPVPSRAGVLDDAQHRSRGDRWVVADPGGPQSVRAEPLVVDLTSLWAGPLCASLLALAGCRVVKVESSTRPDGARRGTAAFYDLLHAGTESVALDLTSSAGVAQLRRLVVSADLVLEASRPRALQQLGVVAQDAVAAGTSWLSLTAYGRTGPWAQRPGFGDDVAAAAGLVARDADGTPLPCGDALADPLAGVHAAVAAAAALLSDRAWLLDVSMRDVAAAAARLPAPAVEVVGTGSGHVVRDATGCTPVAAPKRRSAAGTAPSLGAHTDRVLAELAG